MIHICIENTERSKYWGIRVCAIIMFNTFENVQYFILRHFRFSLIHYDTTNLYQDNNSVISQFNADDFFIKRTCNG